MSPLVDASQLQGLMGDYKAGNATTLMDPLIVPRTQAYKRTNGARLRGLDKGHIKEIPNGQFYVSRKIDGEFNMLVYRDGEAILVNPGGTVRVGLPSLVEAASLLKKSGVKDAIVPCELYFHRPGGKRSRVHDVSRVARRPDNQEDVNHLYLAVFDIVEIDGDDNLGPFGGIRDRIAKIFSAGEKAHPVEDQVVEKCKDIEELFAKWVEKEGIEGLVARSDALGNFKIKPRHTLDVAVIGFSEGQDDRAGMLHDLLLAVVRADGSLHVIGRVGGGFSDQERRDFLSDLKDMVVESDYTEVDSEGVAYQMVRPDWIVEISVLDMVAENTRGASVDRMVIEWDNGASIYRVVRRMPLVSMISPQFIRRREDKHCNENDVGIRQVIDLVDVPMTETNAREFKLPESEILKRLVATKTLKGAQMVRKLLLWRTNKEQASSDYPAFVLHLTDFSPGRKTPLEREILISNSREQIDAFWDSMVEKKIVRGWKVVE